MPSKRWVFITELITLRSTVSGTNTRLPLTSAGQCWLPRAWPSSTQVRMAMSGAARAMSSRCMIITSRRLIFATTARAAAPSQSSTSPSRMNVPRSSDTASSTPPAVFLRKRFFCASQWSSSSASTAAPARRATHSGSLALPRTASTRIIRRPSLAEEVLLVERDRLERRHGGVLAVDRDRERLRVHFDLRGAGIADHALLADLAHVLRRDDLALEAELPLDPRGERGRRDEGDAAVGQRLAVGAEHRPVVDRLRCRERGVRVAHHRPAD